MPARVPELQFAQPVTAFIQGQENALNRQLHEEKLRESTDARERRNRLGPLYQQAIGGDRNALGGIAAEGDIDNAVALGGFQQKDQEAQVEKLGRMASIIANAPAHQRAEAYSMALPEIRKSYPNAPEQWSDDLLPMAEAIAQQSGGARGVQSRFVGQDGQVYLVMRDGTVRPTGLTAEQSYGHFMHTGPDQRERPFFYDKRQGPTSVQTPGGVGGQPAPQQAPQLRSGQVGEAEGNAMFAQYAGEVGPSQGTDTWPPPLDRSPTDFSAPFNPTGGGPTPAEVEAAKGQAKIDVEMRNAPRVADAEAGKTRAVEDAKTDAERRANAPKVRQKAINEVNRADRVLEAVKRAEKNVRPSTAGFIGGNIAGIKGTDAYNLSKTINEIKSNLGFAELQAMRDSSPTGGALGQVAIQELDMLQSTIASLDQGQGPDQLRDAFVRITKHLENWKKIQQAIVNDPESAGMSAPPGSGNSVLDEADAILRGG